MRGIILAAGAGTRLTGSAVIRPKCLAPFDGVPLIQYQIRALHACGVDDIAVVVGYASDRVRLACPGLHFVENTRFTETNSLYSLWLARPLLTDGFVVLNCDVLFHPAMLEDLLTARHENALLVSYPQAGDPPFGDEEMKVTVRRGRVAAISKDLEPGETDGENVGIARFGVAGANHLVTILDRCVANGMWREWAPRAFGEFAVRQPLYALGTRGLPWTEIDTPEDYRYAAERVFPAIAGEAGTEPMPIAALRRGA
jgi:choline kinase